MNETTIRVAGETIPVTAANTVVVGAGAAGMNAALQLVRFWRARGVGAPASRVCVVTASLPGGASRMSGSDKQTYYKLGTSPDVPDTAEDFAKTLTAFGCCDGDTALAEGVGALRGFYNLVEAGVPFPHEPGGAFVGYKTDHDPAQRATSAGPRTSRFMSESLQRLVEAEGIEIHDRRLAASLLTAGEGDDRRAIALACWELGDANVQRPLRLYVARHWILAGGGPGELYADSVYPRGQWGLHGAALEAGLEACNLTESQFGLASTKFRWNVSGTYMQVVPRIFSTDADGSDEREFLTEVFEDMPRMATAIFLKGYQWPFDAQRIAGGGSSLVDMAVHRETAVRGRRVWMDFLRNPVGAPGWEAFSLETLGEEARGYLAANGAMQDTPIERLEHMNRPAIDIYAEHAIDLYREPLEIAVCSQHANGGFRVDAWWRSSVPGVYVVGEMAGTHGVKRPGGSALNAGQVGAHRAAEHIAACGEDDELDPAALPGLNEAVGEFKAHLDRLCAAEGTGAQPASEALEEIRRRMTASAAHLRSLPAVEAAWAEAREQFLRIERDGLSADPHHRQDCIRVRQQAITQLAILAALRAYLAAGGGSRGSYCVLDEEGELLHPELIDPLTGRPYRARPERLADREQILCVRWAGLDEPLTRLVSPRPMRRWDTAFETTWRMYREGRIYDD